MIATLIDAILALVVLEAMVLLVVRQCTGRGPSTAQLLPNLAAGFFLMLAVRLALAPQLGPPALLACLTCALLAHLADLAMRWRA